MAAAAPGEDGSTLEPKRLLDPIDRISEILFGLLMAVTIVGSLSIATAGKDEVRTVLVGALGCNLAWGLVDAVMYLIRQLTEKTRRQVLVRQLQSADSASALRILARALPAGLTPLVGPAEIAAMHARLLALPAGRSRLDGEDFLAAFGVFLLVVVATFPVVLPFVVLSDLPTAMKFSRYITVAMLFAAGHGLGRYAGHPRPFVTGALMALLGVALILAIMALGG
jgi:VIT1/CCC1 family predicted Fe2+/Mn2+ transporter